MRCPDCGYLLLDPNSHCPKCEKTLNPTSARKARPAAPSEGRAAPADEVSGARSYPSLRLNGRGLSGGAATALAYSDDDSSDPNVALEKGESSRTDLRVVAPAVDEISGERSKAAVSEENTEGAGEVSGEVSREEVSDEIAFAENVLDEASAEAPETDEPETTKDTAGGEPAPVAVFEEEAQRSLAEVIAASVATEPIDPGTLSQPVSAFIERAVPAAIETEEIAGEEPEQTLAETEGAVQEPAAQLPPADALARGSRTPSLEDQLSEISISLTRKLGEVPERSGPSEGEMEEATESVFSPVGTSSDVEPGDSEEVVDFDESVVRPARKDAVGDVSEWSLSGFKTMPSAPLPASSPAPVRRVPLAEEFGARTGEIPMPQPRAPSPAAARDDMVEEDPDATVVRGASAAASDPTVDRFSTTSWPSRQQRRQAPDPTQISFPHFSASQVEWPEAEAAATGDYPTADIVGEASTRLSARLPGSGRTWRGKCAGRRAIAFAVDNTLTLSAAALFVGAAHWIVGLPAFRGGEGLPLWQVSGAVFVLRLILDALYEIGAVAAAGKTAGLSLVGLRIVPDDASERPNLSQAIRRWVWLYGLTFGICWGAFRIGRDRYGRALHDEKAGTRIVPA